LIPPPGRPRPLTRALLTPLTWLYLQGFNRKLANATPRTRFRRVICIGNLTAGGAGKTPVAEAIRERITAPACAPPPFRAAMAGASRPAEG
jgi:tetraacyldisaccharide 4'-kinase